MIGESILLHVALRCSKLRSVDASWSNVGDNGIEALVQNVHRLGSAVAITKKKFFPIFGCLSKELREEMKQ